jgi:hypothetical protein
MVPPVPFIPGAVDGPASVCAIALGFCSSELSRLLLFFSLFLGFGCLSPLLGDFSQNLIFVREICRDPGVLCFLYIGIRGPALAQVECRIHGVLDFHCGLLLASLFSFLAGFASLVLDPRALVKVCPLASPEKFALM